MAEEVDQKFDEFVIYLTQKNRFQSTYEVARKTVLFLRDIVSKSKWGSPKELMEKIRAYGKKLISVQPGENVISNMVRRVLKMVREELARCLRGSEEIEVKESLHTMLTGDLKVSVDDFNEYVPALKSGVIEAIMELLVELEESASNIAAQALDHIHANEVIMTAGYSKTVEAFLKGAARKRKFEVIVAEGAPSYQGQEFACSLAKSGMETTLITDSAIFAIMSRVNKVIIGTHTVMADGGLKALNGSHALALAARHHSVPVLVCAAMFKLSPKYLCAYDQDTFNKIVGPDQILNFAEGDLVSRVHIQNPVFDYVPPDLIELFISNIGGNAPSYVYRLIGELYDTDDNDL